MSQKNLAAWLKLIVLSVFICCIVVYAVMTPIAGRSLVRSYPEFSHYYAPWLIFISGSSLPIIAALALSWLVAVNIGRDKSFSRANSRYLKLIAILAMADAGYFFFGNAALLALNLSHPGVIIMAMVVTLIGVSVSIAAAALSRLVLKAAILQEQNDLTI